jgi:phosphohistidine phosphatase
MKTLLFLRHAQAEASAAHDRDRTLTEAGRDAARRAGRFIGMVGPTPDLIFTSTAVRARETLSCAREEGHWSAPIHAADGFYETAPRKLLEDIQFAPEPAATLLLVGHEPTWSRTICRLSGGTELRFPAGSLARVDVDVSAWADVSFGRGQLRWLVPPDLLARILTGAG